MENEMKESDHIREAVVELIRDTAGQLHREDQFTVRLFAKLWPTFRERLLYATGLDVKEIVKQFDCGGKTEVEELRKVHLDKTYDYYADLILTAPLGSVQLTSTLSQVEVLKQVPITHLYEFKYLTAFPSLPRKRAREDTYKLKVLGEYVRLSCGTLPHLEQFIVASGRTCKHKHSLELLLSWFADDEIKKDTEGVTVSIVDVDGTIHRIDK